MGTITNNGHTKKLCKIAFNYLKSLGYKKDEIKQEEYIKLNNKIIGRADFIGNSEKLGLTIIEIGKTEPEKLIQYKLVTKNVYHIPSEEFFDFIQKDEQKNLKELNNELKRNIKVLKENLLKIQCKINSEENKLRHLLNLKNELFENLSKIEFYIDSTKISMENINKVIR